VGAAAPGQARTLTLKRCIPGAEKGLAIGDLLAAVREEFKENQELRNTNPDDWARIAGKKGEPIIHVKSLVGQTKPGERTVEKIVNAGQYL
jgi:proteasome-associated ATPase